MSFIPYTIIECVPCKRVFVGPVGKECPGCRKPMGKISERYIEDSKWADDPVVRMLKKRGP